MALAIDDSASLRNSGCGPDRPSAISEKHRLARRGACSVALRLRRDCTGLSRPSCPPGQTLVSSASCWGAGPDAPRCARILPHVFAARNVTGQAGRNRRLPLDHRISIRVSPGDMALDHGFFLAIAHWLPGNLAVLPESLLCRADVDFTAPSRIRLAMQCNNHVSDMSGICLSLVASPVA